MNKYEVMREFFNENESGCYIVNEGMLVREDFVKSLVDGSNTVIVSGDELIIDLENKGVNAIVSYL